MCYEQKAIIVKGLKKSYQGISVLNDVNITVEKGTIFSLLGSNGAGKTTTIKILTTLCRPDCGCIRINNYDVVENPERVREVISLTGQYAAVDEGLTGLENLIMIARLNHLPAPKEQALKLLTYFNLRTSAERFVSTYSGGMRRKLDIAMSLINNPDVIFLDEPTTGLDPQSRLSMWNIIKALKARGITIFLTTQYLEEAEQLADKIAILDKGKIVVEGTLADVKTLLPQGITELTFSDHDGLEKAVGVLNDYKINIDREQIKIHVYTNVTVTTLTEILNRMASQGIELQDVQRKIPTLEEVFLSLVNEKGDISL